MVDKTYLLNDEQMRHFIVNGYVTVKTDLPKSFHDAIFEQTETVFEKEGNPGNNLLPRIPKVQAVFDDQTVRGALISVLGADYYMQPHRHPHYNPPGSDGQRLHQDGGRRWSHHTRRLLIFYYPQDTPEVLGPTGIVPGSHYYNTPDGAKIREELPVCGEAGTVAIVNYDLWHRAMPNCSDQKRYMMKFLFARMSEPQSPSWNSAHADWSYAGNGRSESTDDGVHQRMFQHVWDWHYGKANGDMPNGHPDHAESTSALFEALGSDSEAICLDAAYALSEYEAPVVPTLIEALGDESEASRRNACYALSAIGAPAVDALISALGARNEIVRASAAETLGDIGLPARAAVPALMEALGDEAEGVRYHAAEALGTTGQLESTAVQALSAVLQDESERVRRNATLALARIGSHAEGAVGALQGALSDENRYVRGDAAHALHRIGTPEAKDVLLRFLITSRWCPLTSKESTY
ncbi:MAG: HEAT repeat domain-containing protein [Candidatus Poribacteria bacterium]|nr:HEAT repeat domain-containing protein [Candidatus Poribacteria bacterium]